MATAFTSADTTPLVRGQRGHARVRIGVPARLVTMNGTSSCVLIDVSQSGARVCAAEPPRVGATVIVERISPELFGTVEWQRGDKFGVRFDTMLTLDDVVQLRQLGDLEPQRARTDLYAHARRWVTGTS